MSATTDEGESHVTVPADTLRVCDLGRMPYTPALDVQRRTHDAVLAGRAAPTLLLVEHDPVITLGRRAVVKRTATRNVLADPDLLRRLGIERVETDRGGDVTYHGPGQVVAYPILPLKTLGLSVSGYMRFLEQVGIDTLAAFAIEGRREKGATGVWVLPPDRGPHGQPAKICALGVRVRKGVTLHGLALNVAPDLSHFRTIVPCGLAGRPVTSIRKLLGDAAPDAAEVRQALVDRFRGRFRKAIESRRRPPAEPDA